jgi:serine/threonine-protein kinase
MELLGAKLDGGRYEIMQRIATGAMGVVYRGRQAPLGREVAIKLLRESKIRCQQSISAFWREARAASMIDHPNVVRVIDFGLDRDLQYFIVMELLEGRSLEDVIGRDPLPSLRWSCEIVAQLLSALAAAHDAGVVHQDVKPGNVKLHRAYDANGDEVDIPKLCDFGLAVQLRARVEDDDQDAGTRAELWGTPEYMSPEQVRGERPTPSTDLYACGVMLYQMATGRLPFEGNDPTVIAAQHLERAPTAPSEIRPGLDPALEAVILRALNKRPLDRFADARAMRVALLEALPPTRRAGDRESGVGVRRSSDPEVAPARRAGQDDPTAALRVGAGASAQPAPAAIATQRGALAAALQRSNASLWLFGSAGVVAGIIVLWLLASLR